MKSSDRFFWLVRRIPIVISNWFNKLFQRSEKLELIQHAQLKIDINNFLTTFSTEVTRIYQYRSRVEKLLLKRHISSF
jgi:hypothetical protein